MSSLAGSARFQSQRVDIGPHHFTERLIDALMTLDQRHPGEFGRDDAHAKVTAPVACAFVAGVPVALVLDIELHGPQCLFQAGANALEPAVHGKVLRNGRTETSR